MLRGIKSVELIDNVWFENAIVTFNNGHVAEFTKNKILSAWGHAGTDNWPATVALAEAIGEDEDKLWVWLNDAINERLDKRSIDKTPCPNLGCYVWITDGVLFTAPMLENGECETDPDSHCEGTEDATPEWIAEANAVLFQENSACVYCGESTAFGSGKFVNRIPVDDGYGCAICSGFECDECEKQIYIDTDIATGAGHYHEECYDESEHGAAED